MSFLTVDHAYANLLTHLQRPRSGISIQTVLSAVPHYLAQLPLPHPTQLTAFVISSPLWKPLSAHGVHSLVTVYRSAVLLIKAKLQKEAGGWFTRSPNALLAEWASAVMKGVSRGNPQLRIAIMGGLLMGLDGLDHDGILTGIRERVERQVVIACAENLGAISKTKDAWRDEFTSRDPEDMEDGDALFLYSAHHILPLVATEKLSALDFLALTRLAAKGVESAFSFGEFLSQLSPSTTREPSGQVAISPESNLADSLKAMSNHTLYKDAGYLAKLLSRCLSLLADQTPPAAWRTYQNVSDGLESVTTKVEKHWKASLLASVASEQEIESETRALSTEIWKALKTLLFTHLAVSQSILSSIPYLRPPSILHTSDPTSSSIACSALRSLRNLSFVVSQFGGVTSTVDGFKELKRVFYMALDIIAADPDPQISNDFVEGLLLRVQESQLDLNHPSRQSETAYALAVVEQVMPILSETIIENNVVPFCHPCLGNPIHRETYESAHSVMLSIFAAHSQQKEKKNDVTSSNLAEKLVPFYVDSLLKNSDENRLSTSQLRLAYSSLVRSAASSGDDALTWLCVDALLVHIKAITPPSSSSRPIHVYLTLISLLSCLPLSLLQRVLSEVQKVLESADSDDRVELEKAVLEEITNKVGDREKEAVLSWWCRVAPGLATASQGDLAV